MCWVNASLDKSSFAHPCRQVSGINRAIGASSAIAMQCKELVKEYLPMIMQAFRDMPLDQVGYLGEAAGVMAALA